MKLLRFGIHSGVFAVLPFVHGASPEQLEQQAEFKVLSNYAGTWEIKIMGRPTAKSVSKGVWVLGGKFLQRSWTLDMGDGSPATSGIHMMTFDTDMKMYRNVCLTSGGKIVEERGFWNADSRTMIWTAKTADGETRVTRAAFPKNATATWSIVTTRADGSLIEEGSGTKIPQKTK
jgi:hypothetical protein